MVTGATSVMGCGVENRVVRSNWIVTKDPFDWISSAFSSRFASDSTKKQLVVDFSHSQGSGEGSYEYIDTNGK